MLERMIDRWILAFVALTLLVNAIANMVMHRRIRRTMEKIGEMARLLGAKTYRIGEDGKSITCLKCFKTSYHPEDVMERYCGACHVFHVR